MFMHFTFFCQSKDERYFINNHLSFLVKYHNDPETDTARIVGFEVIPNRFRCLTPIDCVFVLILLTPGGGEL